MRSLIRWVGCHIVVVLVLFACVMAFGWVGRLDMQDELAEDKFYCEMVRDGNWKNEKDLDCAEILKGETK